MGARPLQRVIDKDIKTLAREMLFGKLGHGGSLIIEGDASSRCGKMKSLKLHNTKKLFLKNMFNTIS